MFYTARAAGPVPGEVQAGADGPVDGRGVIGGARSKDLVRWEALPPVSEPGEFGELEVPQPVRLGGRWYLLFCTAKHAAARLARPGAAGRWFGTYYLVGDRPTGPFRLLGDEPLVGDARGTYYAGRIVEDGPGGGPVFLAWRQWAADGSFLGGLSQPAPVRVLPDGRLAVEQAALWPAE